MSKKYNTTRQRVLGVATRGRTQVVFYDTPGIVAAEDRGRYFRPLVVSAAETVPLADVVVFVVDLARRWGWAEKNTLREVVALAAFSKARLLVTCNKGDLLQGRNQVDRKVDGILNDWEVFAHELGAPGPEEFADVAAAQLLEMEEEGPPDDFRASRKANSCSPKATSAPTGRSVGEGSGDSDGSIANGRRRSLAMAAGSWDSDVGGSPLPSGSDDGAHALPAHAAEADHSDEAERLQVWAADVPPLFVTSALRGDGVPALETSLLAMAVPRPWYVLPPLPVNPLPHSHGVLA